MIHRRGLLLGLAAIVLALVVSALHADFKDVKPSDRWTGSINNDKLRLEAPTRLYLTDAKAFEKLWTTWGVGEKTPQLDFDKVMVVVATTVGSKLTVTTQLDEKGNLVIGTIATRDLRDGFRYEVQVISREGVKTVNGKEIGKD
jgi:hypothetical protein